MKGKNKGLTLACFALSISSLLVPVPLAVSAVEPICPPLAPKNETGSRGPALAPGSIKPAPPPPVKVTDAPEKTLAQRRAEFAKLLKASQNRKKEQSDPQKFLKAHNFQRVCREKGMKPEESQKLADALSRAMEMNKKAIEAYARSLKRQEGK